MAPRFSDQVTDEERISDDSLFSKKLFDKKYYPFKSGPLRPENGSPFLPEGAPIPENDSFRLEVLNRYNLLDTPPEPKFDRLTALAAKMFKVNVALISLVDKKRQFFKSNYGLPCGCSDDRKHSFCAWMLLPSKEPCLIVEDAREDSRFCNNKLVVEFPFIRFYAGAPLVTKAGFILGSLCVIDNKPRKFSADERETLVSLADFVMAELDKHAQVHENHIQQTLRFEHDKRGLLDAIDAFSEGLVLVDTSLEGQPIVYVNGGWEKITGYSSEEVIGKHCGTLLQGPLTDATAVKALKDACREGKPASVELLNYRKDGTVFWNWVRIRPVECASKIASLASSSGGGSGSCRDGRYYFGILSDCTARKEKEMQLEKIRMDELAREASARAKRQFLANISHEIRTPMNAIIASSQLLSDSYDLADEPLELVKTVAGAGQQLLALINDILDFSKLDAGKMAIQRREFNVWSCLDFCMEMLKVKAQTNSLDLSYNIDPSVPHFILGDEVRLRQVLINLLSNAIKFTEEGGEVEVSVVARRQNESSDVEERSTRNGTDGWNRFPLYEIEFSVRDTGLGMPPEFLDVIFDAFTQCDNSRTRKFDGTGLGMAIAKELSEMMGGRIWVESRVSHGSTFFFTIAARGAWEGEEERKKKKEKEEENEEEEGQVTPFPPKTPLTGRRALVVGPAAPVHRAVGSMLASWGATAVAADSPAALEAALASCVQLQAPVSKEAGGGASSLPFDVLIVDSQLPPPPPPSASSSSSSSSSFPASSPSSWGDVIRRLSGRSAVLPTVLLRGVDPVGPASDGLPENVYSLCRPIRSHHLYKVLLQVLGMDKKPFPIGPPVAELARLEVSKKSDLRILIAEDNFVNQKVLLKLLRTLGFESCTTAVNGAKVLEVMQDKSFDLILMDVQMPVMDGLCATAELRRTLPESKQPLIAALTADVGSEIEAECEEAGMNWYLSKPIMKAELQELLKFACQLLGDSESRNGAHRRWLKH